MTVLILAQEFDPTADAVVMALARRQAPVFRTDLAAFPRQLRLDARLRTGRWIGRLWNENRSVAVEDIRSVWNRNPRGYDIDGVHPADHEFCYTEARLGVGGVLAALNVLWANHPNRCADAIFKPYQWRVAAECGLPVADTVITNDPVSARRFIAEAASETITKALGPSGVTEQGRVKVAYTRRVTPTTWLTRPRSPPPRQPCSGSCPRRSRCG